MRIQAVIANRRKIQKMKKRTKITLRTKIYLTTVALLAFTGVIYGSASFFSPVLGPLNQGPVGVAASQTDLFASDFCIGLLNPSHRNIEKVNCDATFSAVTSIPSFVGDTCEEMYIAMAPIQSANAGFTPRDVFITNGIFIYRFTPPNPPNPLTAADIFATIPDTGCNPDHTGITFDHVGTFGNNMIVTCKAGGVWQVNGVGTPTHIADRAVGAQEIEGPAVVPASFGPFGGQIMVADEDRGSVHAIKNDGTVTLDVIHSHWRGKRPGHPGQSVHLLLGRRPLPGDNTK